MSQKSILLTYYGSTILFLLLDLVFHYSVRVTFLDTSTGFRMLYYGFCMLCFVIMLWKPGLTVLLAAVESLVTLSALILVMGMRVMVPTDQLIETGAGLITPQEIINFVLAGGIAYVTWGSSVQQLRGRGR
jgi:hypothetical protein